MSKKNQNEEAEAKAKVEEEAPAAQAKAAQEAGTVRLNGKGVKSCSYKGVIFTADKDGCFVVPAEAESHLSSHGFVRA